MVMSLHFWLSHFNCPSDVLIGDDPLQSRRNLRIKHLKIGEKTPFY